MPRSRQFKVHGDAQRALPAHKRLKRRCGYIAWFNVALVTVVFAQVALVRAPFPNNLRLEFGALAPHLGVRVDDGAQHQELSG